MAVMLVAFAVVIPLLVYWYLTRKHDYWKQVGIPYIKPVPVLGSMGQAFSQPLHDVELNRYKDKGRVYGSYEGSRPVITLGDPDVLRNIMVKDFQFFSGRRIVDTGNPLADRMVQNLQGEDWKRVRGIITPAFTTGKIRRMTSIFVDSAKALIRNFKTAASEDKPVDAKKLFAAFTMDVIASSAFGTKIDSHNDPENPFVTYGRSVFSKNVPWRAALFFLFPGLIKFFRISIFSPESLKFFENVTLKILQERKRGQPFKTDCVNGDGREAYSAEHCVHGAITMTKAPLSEHVISKKRNDLLQLLIDCTDEGLEKEADTAHNEKDTATEMGHEEGNDQIFKQYYSTKSLSTDELIAQCIIFFLAGFETTASTLSFTAYELALNPDIQDRLIAEIDETLREKGEINYDALSGMKYMENVIAETLRKYPPAVRGERRAEEDYDVKNHNVTVPKGMLVSIPIYAIHHDPEHYPDPEKYDPDRFTPEKRSHRHPYTYLPFGAGPRNCIGMRFALMEIKVCLFHVLSQCRFSICPETKVPLEFFRGQGLMQAKEVTLRVELRKDAQTL